MTVFTDSYTGHQASLSQNMEKITQFRHKNSDIIFYHET